MFGPDSTKNAFDPPQFLWPVSSAVGNAEAGIAAGDVKLERTYSTADRHHNQIEPHVTAAVWDSAGTLTLYTPTQYLFGERELVSIVLGLAAGEDHDHFPLRWRRVRRQGLCLAPHACLLHSPRRC